MNQTGTWTIGNAQMMEAFGAWAASLFQTGDVVYLRGEMGSGKTTMVRGIARAWGYQGRVSSPTFTLLNLYATERPIYHIDFYRIENDEVADLGLDDFTDGIILMEWPEIGKGIVPEADWIFDIALQAGDYDLPRKVTLYPADLKRYEEWKESHDAFGY